MLYYEINLSGSARHPIPRLLLQPRYNRLQDRILSQSSLKFLKKMIFTNKNLRRQFCHCPEQANIKKIQLKRS